MSTSENPEGGPAVAGHCTEHSQHEPLCTWCVRSDRDLAAARGDLLTPAGALFGSGSRHTEAEEERLTTAEALDALPVGSRYLDRFGDVGEIVAPGMVRYPETADLTTAYAVRFLPGQVTHRPDAPAAAPATDSSVEAAVLDALHAYQAECDANMRAESVRIFGHPGAFVAAQVSTRAGRLAAISGALAAVAGVAGDAVERAAEAMFDADYEAGELPGDARERQAEFRADYLRRARAAVRAVGTGVGAVHFAERASTEAPCDETAPHATTIEMNTENAEAVLSDLDGDSLLRLSIVTPDALWELLDDFNQHGYGPSIPIMDAASRWWMAYLHEVAEDTVLHLIADDPSDLTDGDGYVDAAPGDRATYPVRPLAGPWPN